MSRSIFASAVIPLRLVFLMWMGYFVQITYSWTLSYVGILPRQPIGLIGIFTAPLIHANIFHLLSNTVPMLFLGTVLFYFYPNIGRAVFYRSYFLTNILVWLFARSANHIGASGVVYGLAFFLIFFGFFKRDFRSIFISIVILITYGGVFYGVLPTDPSISWESHFAGALVGLYTAVVFGTKKT